MKDATASVLLVLFSAACLGTITYVAASNGWPPLQTAMTAFVAGMFAFTVLSATRR